MDTPRLITPEKNYAASYAEALREGLHLEPTKEAEILRVENDFDGWLRERTDLSVPVTLPDGRQVPRMPNSTFWLVAGADRFLGAIGVRHQLSESLMKFGGHVGYAVRKSERNKGYGTLMFRMVMPHVKALGLEKILVTCNDDNVGSIKIIEAAGGVLEDKIPIFDRPMLHRRYWITL